MLACVIRYVAAVLAACAVSPALAQLRLPGGLGSLPGVPDIARRLPAPVAVAADSLNANVPLQDLRRSVTRNLLERHPSVLEPGPGGEPVVRGVLLLASPAAELLAAATTQGFRVLRTDVLEGLNESIVALAPPRGMSLAEAVARLRAIDPQATVDYNHLYTRSGSVEAGAAASAVAPAAAAPRRVGLIDGGLDLKHRALRGARTRTWGCNGSNVPSAHGTAVASLLVGQDGNFSGSAVQATLFAADIYCSQPTGGATDQLAQALAWMARERVAVINVSLVGPPSSILERAVRALTARGHLVVAAVGNDGPTAPPLYPAAYPGVVGVTGVGARKSVLPEAAQGPQVAFAAVGADLAVAEAGERGYVVARGTSFAAPTVAGLLSEMLPDPDVDGARLALLRLQQSAVDLGAPGRDEVYGWGLLDWLARATPAQVGARSMAAH